MIKEFISKENFLIILSFSCWLLVLPLLTGCGTLLFNVNKEKTRNFTITGSDYNEAFSKAMRAANEIGLSIFSSDKNAGTFYASKGAGYLELSELNLLIEKDSQGGLSGIVRVKSSKGENLINDFLISYSKYVKVIQN